MRRTLAGPGSSTSTYQAKLDPGKAAPAGTGGEYRRTATATGPGASGAEYIPTQGMLISRSFSLIIQVNICWPNWFPFVPFVLTIDQIVESKQELEPEASSAVLVLHLDPNPPKQTTLPPQVRLVSYFSSQFCCALTSFQDSGKQAGAGSGGEFRRVGTAAGPASSQTAYTATQDAGKQLPAGQGGDYRRAGAAAGPQSSHASYTPTQDPGLRIPLHPFLNRNFSPPPTLSFSLNVQKKCPLVLEVPMLITSATLRLTSNSNLNLIYFYYAK